MLSLLVTNWKDESPHFTLQRPLEQRAGSTVEEAQSFAVWLSWNMVAMFSKRIWGINKFALMVISVIWCFKYHLAGQLLTCPLLTTRWFCTHLRCFLILDFSSAFVICQADALWVICQLSPKQYFCIHLDFLHPVDKFYTPAATAVYWLDSCALVPNPQF